MLARLGFQLLILSSVGGGGGESNINLLGWVSLARSRAHLIDSTKARSSNAARAERRPREHSRAKACQCVCVCVRKSNLVCPYQTRSKLCKCVCARFDDLNRVASSELSRMQSNRMRLSQAHSASLLANLRDSSNCASYASGSSCILPHRRACSIAVIAFFLLAGRLLWLPLDYWRVVAHHCTAELFRLSACVCLLRAQGTNTHKATAKRLFMAHPNFARRANFFRLQTHTHAQLAEALTERARASLSLADYLAFARTLVGAYVRACVRATLADRAEVT